MLTPNTQVTIEANSELDGWTGLTATLVKVVRCFAILNINGNIHSCIVDGIKPKVTAESLAARIEIYN